jgi:galactonate dehydratase
MKITDVKVWLVQGIKYNWTLLKIYTDEGYTGVGEATNWPGSPIGKTYRQSHYRT